MRRQRKRPGGTRASRGFLAKVDRLLAHLGKVAARREWARLRTTGVSSYRGLLGLARDERADPDLRSTAYWLLARLAGRARDSVLLAAMHDARSEIRTAAAQGLGTAGSRGAVAPLVGALAADGEKAVRQAAAHALGLLGRRRAVPALIATLRSPTEDPRVRGMAAESLGTLGDPRGLRPLVAALDDSSREVRYWAAFALGELGDPRALPGLRRLGARSATLPARASPMTEARAAIRRIKAKARSRGHDS